jgi:16S rRNA (guanine527-N7)-methyltransferase
MFKELLAKEFAPWAQLSEQQLRHLERHYELLTLWNKKLNLARLGSIEDAVRLHYCESLFLARTLPSGSLRIVDVGSGAGFPGLPVAILRPESTIDLLESHYRKSVFLTEVCRNLPNVHVLSRRAESCEPNYDWMIARGVRPEAVLGLSLAPEAALLITSRELQGLKMPFGLEKIPWGKNRIVAMFHVEHGKI